MLWANTGKSLLPIFGELNRILQPPTRSIVLSAPTFAARKGTRERKQKLHVKKVVQKVAYVPFHLRKTDINAADRPIRKFDDSNMPIPEDNVFLQRHFRSIVYSFEEAVKCHREVQHPDMYNNPNANLHVTIELYMQGEKKTRFIENFSRVVAMPHKFNHGQERSILVFVKDEAIKAAARSAGANLVGGMELIKEIQSGTLALQDFMYIIAHPDILPELVSIRGLLKKKFPSPKTGTLDVDLASVVDRFLNGINYSAVKDDYEKDFGIIQTVIGTIDMNPKDLEENLAALLQDVIKSKPKRSGHFISRCLLLSPPSDEKLKVDHLLYVTDETKKEILEDEAEPVQEQIIGVV